MRGRTFKGARPILRLLVLAAGAGVILAAGALDAGGPLITSKSGVPRRWSSHSPVKLNLDPGALGQLASPATYVQLAIEQWNSVATATVKLEIGEPLKNDIEGLSESQFSALIGKDDGTNPVIFDSSGETFENLFGPDSGVIGVAGPSLIVSSDGRIVKGFAMFNGAVASPGSAEILRAAMTHELGHFLNLDHTQLNGTRVESTLPGFVGTVEVDDVETMFPVLLQTSVKPHPMSTVARDDAVALSSIYPAASFATTTGSITGVVFDVDGATHLQGVNVIARNVDNPFEDAVSFVSGGFVDRSSSSVPADLLGAFELRGLTPNASYKVYIEEIAEYFREGARVGPLDPPLDLDPTQPVAFLEFWNGVLESADDPPDDPIDADLIHVTAGGTMSHVDFIFNGVRPRVRSIEPSSCSYLTGASVVLTGANFSSGAAAALRNTERSFVITVLDVDGPSSMRAAVPPGVIPGVYDVIVRTQRGESEPSEVQFTVTEPPATVSSVLPGVVENDRPSPLTVQGKNLLGAEAVRLRRVGLPDVLLDSVTPSTSLRLAALVPAGVYPGEYSVIVVNTSGDGVPSSPLLRIVELEPVLSGESEPQTANNSKSKDVRILGTNLTGTSNVELVGGPAAVPLVIKSTALDQVVVTIPGGLDPGIYTVRLTNTEGTATGPTTFSVKKASGGGGGCSASPPTPPCSDKAEAPDASWVLLIAAVLLARRARGRPQRD